MGRGGTHCLTVLRNGVLRIPCSFPKDFSDHEIRILSSAGAKGRETGPGAACKDCESVRHVRLAWNATDYRMVFSKRRVIRRSN